VRACGGNDPAADRLERIEAETEQPDDTIVARREELRSVLTEQSTYER
jgi:hypothetical protein